MQIASSSEVNAGSFLRREMHYAIHNVKFPILDIPANPEAMVIFEV